MAYKPNQPKRTGRRIATIAPRNWQVLGGSPILETGCQELIAGELKIRDLLYFRCLEYGFCSGDSCQTSNGNHMSLAFLLFTLNGALDIDPTAQRTAYRIWPSLEWGFRY